MADQRHIITNGIILKTSKSGEINKNFIIISPDLGVLHGTAFGALKSKSRFCSTVQPFIEAKFYLYKSPKSDFFKLDDLSDVNYIDFINDDIKYFYLLSFLSDAIISSYISNEEFKSFYYLLKYSLEIIKEKKDIYLSFLFFASKFIFLSGYNFYLTACKICGEKSENLFFNFNEGAVFCDLHKKNYSLSLNINSSLLFKNLLEQKYITIKDFTIEKENFNELFPIIISIFKHIFEKELKTISYIRTIF